MSSFTEYVLALGVISVFASGVFGSFGAIVQYLYLTVKGEKEYSRNMLFIYSILGFFVGLLADLVMKDFLGQTYAGIVLLSGFLVIKILDFLDTKGLGIILRGRK